MLLDGLSSGQGPKSTTFHASPCCQELCVFARCAELDYNQPQNGLLIINIGPVSGARLAEASVTTRSNRAPHPLQIDPRQQVCELHERLGSWHRVAAAIGAYSAAYWDLVAQGKVDPSPKARAALRRALGLCRLAEMEPTDLAWRLRHRETV